MGRLPLGSPARRRGSSVVRRSVDFRKVGGGDGGGKQRASPASSLSSSQKTAATLESEDCHGFGAYDWRDLQADDADEVATRAEDVMAAVATGGDDESTLNGDAATTLTELIHQVSAEERFSAWAASSRREASRRTSSNRHALPPLPSPSSSSSSKARSPPRSPPRHSILPTIAQLGGGAAAQEDAPKPSNHGRSVRPPRRAMQPRARPQQQQQQQEAFPRGITEEQPQSQSLPPLMATPIYPVSPSSSPTPLLSPHAESESESSAGSPSNNPSKNSNGKSQSNGGGGRSLGSKILPKLHMPSLPHSRKTTTTTTVDSSRKGKHASRPFGQSCHRDFNIGYVHLQTGRYRKALPHLEKSLQAYIMVRGADHLEVAKVHEVLGMAHDGMGDADTAITHWEAVLRIISLHHARDDDDEDDGEEEQDSDQSRDWEGEESSTENEEDESGPQSVDRKWPRRRRRRRRHSDGGASPSSSSLSSSGVDTDAMRSRVKEHLMRLGVNPNARPQSHLAEC